MQIIQSDKKTTNQLASLTKLKQFYHAAKKRTWEVKGLGWDDYPPVPRVESERWRLLWSSVVRQQLQADLIAVEASTQLLLAVPEHEARMYYSTMVQDEGKHVEGWTQLVHMLDDVDAENPYLRELGEMILDAKLIEQKVVGFQVVFEGAVIPAFKDIAVTAQKTVLGEMASRLVRDDSIHHHSGVAYAHYLLDNAPLSLRREITQTAQQYLPVYLESVRWRPPVRRWLDRFMKERDEINERQNREFIGRALNSLNIPIPSNL
jgi:hypothetical protein